MTFVELGWSYMTTDQVQAAHEIDDHMVISVAKHKTARTVGPTKVVLPKSLYQWMIIFVEKILPQILCRSATEDTCVFLTVSGEVMSSG